MLNTSIATIVKQVDLFLKLKEFFSVASKVDYFLHFAFSKQGRSIFEQLLDQTNGWPRARVTDFVIDTRSTVPQLLPVRFAPVLDNLQILHANLGIFKNDSEIIIIRDDTSNFRQLSLKFSAKFMEALERRATTFQLKNLRHHHNWLVMGYEFGATSNNEAINFFYLGQLVPLIELYKRYPMFFTELQAGRYHPELLRDTPAILAELEQQAQQTSEPSVSEICAGLGFFAAAAVCVAVAIPIASTLFTLNK